MMYVIEPHADDAFLSLHGHIQGWVKSGRQVTIVTVLGAGKRDKEAEAYALHVGASWEGFGLSEGGSSTDAPSPDLVAAVRKAARRLASRLDGSEDTLVLPISIRHTEHLMVRDAFVAVAPTTPTQYYLDQPYSSIMKNGPAVQAQLRGTTIASYLKPNARKYGCVRFFKSQGKFWFYNPPESMKGNIEMVVEN